MKNARGLLRRLAAFVCTLALAVSLTPGALARKTAASCAHGQNPGWWSYRSVQASCTAQGRSYRVCTRCGAEETLSTTPMTEHSWQQKTEEATASRDGKVYRVCRICGKRETLSTIGAKLHAGSGSTTVNKLSQKEIARLLRDTPLLESAVSGDCYEVRPSAEAPYAAGKVRSSVLQAALDRLNLYRRLAGVPVVTLDEELCESAQHGATVLAADGRLRHDPARPEGMEEAFYQKGAAAAAASNLASGYSLTGAVDAWMTDSDPANLSRLGHRSWQLNPTLGKVGFGIAEGYAALSVLDRSGAGCAYDFLAWPASGNFPDELIEDTGTAWSIQLNPDVYSVFSVKDLTVTLTGGGRSWTFRGKDAWEPSQSGRYFGYVAGGYGDGGPCIIFRPDGVKEYKGSYTVEVQGLRDADGLDRDLQYRVTFFHAGNVVLTAD